MFLINIIIHSQLLRISYQSTEKCVVRVQAERRIIESGQLVSTAGQSLPGMSKVKQIFYITSSLNRRSVTTLHVRIGQALDER